MRTDKYYSASADIAERGGFTPYRHKIEGGRYLLSESDIRNMIALGLIGIDEMRDLDIIEIDSEEADRLILEGKAAETREAAGITDVDADNTEQTEETDHEGEPAAGDSDMKEEVTETEEKEE